MATTTMTPAQSWFQPNTNPGVQVVTGEMLITATGTVFGSLWLAKIPHGATILDGRFYVGAAASGDIEIGVSATHSVFLSTATLAGAAWHEFDVSFNYLVSVSDDATQRYDIIKASQSLSWSGTYKFQIFYSMDTKDQHGTTGN